MNFVRSHLSTFAVAAVTALVVSAGPAAAGTIVALANNALHLGGKSPSAYLLVTAAAKKYETKSHAASTYATKAAPAYKDVGVGTNPPFDNTWVNCPSGGPYTSVGFYKDSQNIVHLKGCLSGPSHTAAFTLPTGYRPSAELFLSAACFGPKAGNIEILSDGEVIPSCEGGGTNQEGIDGLSFRVGPGDA
jgi:hypothetical protein